MTFVYEEKQIGNNEEYYVAIQQQKFECNFEVVGAYYGRIESHNYYTDYKKAKRQFNALCRKYRKETEQ